MTVGKKILLALTGLAGSGKTEVAGISKQYGFTVLRLGDVTEKILVQKKLPLTPENEEYVRENLRKQKGMAAFAIELVPHIEETFKTTHAILLEGVRSWEEYEYVKKIFPSVLLIGVWAPPQIRYQRLEKRAVRPFTIEEAKERDVKELEHLHMGPTLALADRFVINDSTLDILQQRVDEVIGKIMP